MDERREFVDEDENSRTKDESSWMKTRVRG